MQYAESKVDYLISEFIYMLPIDMNLWIGKVKNYNNKILISSPSFKIGTNLKVNLNGEKDKPDVKSKREPDIKSNKECKQDVKPDIKFNKESEPDMITYDEEKVALVLGMTTIFYTMVDIQMIYLLFVFVMKYVYIKAPTHVMRAHKF